MSGPLPARAFFGGSAVFFGMMAPLAFGAVRWRKRLAPRCDRATARMVEALLVFFGAVGVAQLLGSLGAFRRWPVLAACLTAGVGAGLMAGRGHRDAEAQRSSHRPAMVAACLVVAFVAARWSVGMFTTLAAGPLDVDTQTYHLPHAASFFQDAWLTRLHFPTVDDAIPYHPLNGEIVHAYGMLAFGRDILSPFVNLVFLTGALGATWLIGERFKRGHLAVIGACALLAVPLVTTTQGGSAMTDIVALFSFLAAVALLLRAAERAVHIGIAGLACGLAVGSKLTIAVPVAVLTAVAIWGAPAFGYKRWALARRWMVPMVLAGGFWYARNLAHVGSPLPALRIGLGRFSLPRPPIALIDRYGYSVADYAFDGDVWRRSFVPGLAQAFGRAWPVVVIPPLIALAFSALRGRPRPVRGLAAVGLIAAVGYAFIPTTALGPPGDPALFAGNLRYLVPALVLGLVLAPALWSAHPLPDGAFVALMLLPLLAGIGTGWGDHAVGAAAVGLIAALATVAIAVLRPLPRRPTVAAALALVVLALLGGYAIQQRYLQSRYRAAAYRTGGADRAAFAWAQDLRGVRIGMAGFFVNYPLYGSDLSNRVAYVGDLRSDGAFTDYTRCADWRAAVNEGGYEYIVTMPPFPDRAEPPAAGWTRSDPGATEVLRRGRVSVFRTDGSLDPHRCPGA